MLVEEWLCGFVLGELPLEAFDSRADLMNLRIGKKLMKLFQPGFALGNFGFDFGELAIGEFAFAALFEWTLGCCFIVRGCSFWRGTFFSNGGVGGVALVVIDPASTNAVAIGSSAGSAR